MRLLYPKVCSVCCQPHILCEEEEVRSEDDKRSIHVECVGKEPLVREYKDNRELGGA